MFLKVCTCASVRIHYFTVHGKVLMNKKYKHGANCVLNLFKIYFWNILYNFIIFSTNRKKNNNSRCNRYKHKTYNV